MVSDDHARALPHSDARNAVRGDGADPKRSLEEQQSTARMGQSLTSGRRSRLRRQLAGCTRSMITGEPLGSAGTRPASPRARDRRLLDHPARAARARRRPPVPLSGRLGSSRVGRCPGEAARSDPSKIVWRAASAWALRHLGNQGLGVDSIKAALEDANPASPDAARREIFAYQFHGMDTRLDLAAARLLELSEDPDLWTRHSQALRSFCDSGSIAPTGSAFDTADHRHLPREDGQDPISPSCTYQNLNEGAHIMLDEKPGGGVSLQNNIIELPATLRPRAFAAPTRVRDSDVLLTPVPRHGMRNRGNRHSSRWRRPRGFRQLVLQGAVSMPASPRG